MENNVRITNKKVLKVFIINFLSLLCLEMIFKFFTKTITYYSMDYYMILFNAFLACLLSFFYIAIFRFHKFFMVVLFVFLGLIYYLYIVSYLKYNLVVNYYNFFSLYYLKEVLDFKIHYLTLLIPFGLIVFLPKKGNTPWFYYLKPVININLFLVLLMLLVCFTKNSKSDDMEYNITKESYNYGIAYSTIAELYSKRTDLRLVKNYLDEDTLPREGFKSNSYADMNLLQIDIQGLDEIFINDQVMPNLNSFLNFATTFSNFYAIDTPKTESAYFMIDTGLYLDNNSNLNTYSNLDKVYNHDLISGFENASYQTNFYTNGTQSSYNYAKSLGFDNCNIYLSSSYNLLSQVATELDTTKNYTRIVLDNSEILNTEINDNFKDLDISDELKHYYSYMYEIDSGFGILMQNLIINGQFLNTVIMINNTKVAQDLYYDIIDIDNTRSGLDFYKTPLIFIDHQKAISSNVCSSFVDLFAGISDAFSLSSLDVQDSINFSCFFNPDNTVMFLDGSIVSTYYYYVSKNNTYYPRDYSYYENGDNYAKALSSIESTRQRYKISQIALSGKYYHYLYV